MLRYTSLTSLAVLTSKWRSNHAQGTEVLVIKLPKTEEFVDHSLLLAPATRFWNKAGIFDHTQDVEVRTGTIRNCKYEVEKRI